MSERHSSIPSHYRQWEEGIDPFEELIGPFYFGRDDDGVMRGAFYAEERHLNGGGMVHGGMLMSFADFGLFVTARDALDGGYAVTVAFNSEFVSAGKPGALVQCEGEVIRATRSLIFLRGRIFQAGQTLLAYSGIVKKVRTP